MRLSRWKKFCLILFCLHAVACIWLSFTYADTWWKFAATTILLYIFFKTGQRPFRPPEFLYMLGVPVALYLASVSSWYARPGTQFPVTQYLASTAILLLPVGLNHFQSRCRRPWAFAHWGILFAVALAFYQWRVDVEYAPGSYLFYNFPVSYTVLLLLLPQFICCDAGMRRAIRMSLSQFAPGRMLACAIIGVICLALSLAIDALVFTIFGASHHIAFSPLGGTVASDAYANPISALGSHALVILGVYTFIAMPEELFFRFVLPAAIVRRLREKPMANARWNKYAPVVLSSLAFGLIHWNQASPIWTKVLLCFITGMIFSGIMRSARTLQASSIAHAINNDVPRMNW